MVSRPRKPQTVSLRRITLTVVSIVRVRADRLLLGFIVATSFLSMWISNSATAMLIVPIGTAVIVSVGTIDEQERETAEGYEVDELVAGVRTDSDERPATGFGLALMLGIAYSASIGGVAILIGSPPNAVFAGGVESHLDVQIAFLDWLVFTGPLSIVILLDQYISSGIDEYAIRDFFERDGIGSGFGPGTALVTSTDAPKVEASTNSSRSNEMVKCARR